MSWVRNPLAAPKNLFKFVSICEHTLPRIIQPSLPVTLAAAVVPARLYAGTSGWAYPTWKPDFYPAGTPAKRFLEFYASHLPSVEVNYTFRALPTVKMLEDWLGATPAHFRFSFKAPQRITHFKRLNECRDDVAQFVSALEPVRQAGKLGLLLFQLPPNFTADAQRLTAFLATSALRDPGAPRIAFEFRNQSWFNEEIFSILRQHDAALCIAETEDFTTPEIHTAAGHTSFRLRRTGAYSSSELDEFARRFTPLTAERDVYIYFKHEDEPSGALNAVAFLASAIKRTGQE